MIISPFNFKRIISMLVSNNHHSFGKLTLTGVVLVRLVIGRHESIKTKCTVMIFNQT